ncbi:MAG: MATE family efflux transporter [Armatimonadota bacterium]
MSAVLTKPITALQRRWRRPAGYAEVLVLAAPLILSTGTMTIQQFANRVFLSWYSPEALAASLPAGALSFTIICFFIGACSYANTFVAQYYGSGQSHRIAASVWQAVYLGVLGSLIILPLGLLARPLFDLAGHDPQVRELEAGYFRLLIFGGGFAIIPTALSGFFTGRGCTRTVMWVNIGVTLVNVVLDYLLIFGYHGLPRLGIIGAGWATVISSALGTAVFLVIFVFGADGRRFAVWQGRRFDRELFLRLLRFGTPSGLHFMLDLLAWSIFIMLVGRLGIVALGATNLAFQINSVVFMPMTGMAVATATLVGQRLGQDDHHLAARTTWSAFQMTFAYMSAIALLYVLIPNVFLVPFGAKADPAQFAAVQETAVIMLRFVALYSLFDGANLIFSAALKGAGDTLFVMVISSSLSMSLMVLPTWLICRDGKGSLWAAWIALTSFICVLAICFIWRFLQGKWRTMRVVECPPPPVLPTYAQPDVPATDAEMP